MHARACVLKPMLFFSVSFLLLVISGVMHYVIWTMYSCIKIATTGPVFNTKIELEFMVYWNHAAWPRLQQNSKHEWCMCLYVTYKHRHSSFNQINICAHAGKKRDIPLFFKITLTLSKIVWWFRMEFLYRHSPQHKNQYKFNENQTWIDV